MATPKKMPKELWVNWYYDSREYYGYAYHTRAKAEEVDRDDLSSPPLRGRYVLVPSPRPRAKRSAKR